MFFPTDYEPESPSSSLDTFRREGAKAADGSSIQSLLFDTLPSAHSGSSLSFIPLLSLSLFLSIPLSLSFPTSLSHPQVVNGKERWKEDEPCLHCFVTCSLPVSHSLTQGSESLSHSLTQGSESLSLSLTLSLIRFHDPIPSHRHTHTVHSHINKSSTTDHIHHRRHVYHLC